MGKENRKFVTKNKRITNEEEEKENSNTLSLHFYQLIVVK